MGEHNDCITGSMYGIYLQAVLQRVSRMHIHLMHCQKTGEQIISCTSTSILHSGSSGYIREIESTHRWTDHLTWKAGMLIPSKASGRSSISTFANVAVSLFSVARSAKMGAIFAHGLHHPAVKSTTKSGSDLTTKKKTARYDISQAIIVE